MCDVIRLFDLWLRLLRWFDVLTNITTLGFNKRFSFCKVKAKFVEGLYKSFYICLLLVMTREATNATRDKIFWISMHRNPKYHHVRPSPISYHYQLLIEGLSIFYAECHLILSMVSSSYYTYFYTIYVVGA